MARSIGQVDPHIEVKPKSEALLQDTQADIKSKEKAARKAKQKNFFKSPANKQITKHVVTRYSNVCVFFLKAHATKIKENK